MKESFILYNSFYEPIKALKNEQLGKLFRSIFDYTINGEITQDPEIVIAFMFIKNQIDKDAQKWQEEKNKRSEAGRIGGIQRALNKNQALSSKSKQCLDELSKGKQTQANQGDNVNVNVNVNDNGNIISSITTTTNINNSNNNIYSYIEENFNRTISPLEYEKISSWLNDYEENVIKYAVEKAVFSNKKTFNYVNGILKNWKSSGYKNLKEIKEEEKSRQEVSTEKKELFDYDWLNE